MIKVWIFVAFCCTRLRTKSVSFAKKWYEIQLMFIIKDSLAKNVFARRDLPEIKERINSKINDKNDKHNVLVYEKISL